MVNAVQTQLGWKHYPCYAHTLHLIVNDGLLFREVNAILEKVKKLCLISSAAQQHVKSC